MSTSIPRSSKNSNNNKTKKKQQQQPDVIRKLTDCLVPAFSGTGNTTTINNAKYERSSDDKEKPLSSSFSSSPAPWMSRSWSCTSLSLSDEEDDEEDMNLFRHPWKSRPSPASWVTESNRPGDQKQTNKLSDHLHFSSCTELAPASSWANLTAATPATNEEEDPFSSLILSRMNDPAPAAAIPSSSSRVVSPIRVTAHKEPAPAIQPLSSRSSSPRRTTRRNNTNSTDAQRRCGERSNLDFSRTFVVAKKSA